MPQSLKPFSGIFVSYRRDDSSGHAGRLFDRLVSHFGEDRIFMDVDAIEPGEDFVTIIENAVGSCEVLIAIIGPQWLRTGQNTGRWDNPHDFVRLEIATALSRDIRVIPVLVHRASMPQPKDLPDDLAKFTRRNAIELSDLRWQSDVDKLIGVLDRFLAQRKEAIRLAEASRQAGEERQRREEEEKRRVEAERVRLAEEEAKRRAAEERRLQEDKERRYAEERARLDIQESAREKPPIADLLAIPITPSYRPAAERSNNQASSDITYHAKPPGNDISIGAMVMIIIGVLAILVAIFFISITHTYVNKQPPANRTTISR